MKRYGWMVLGAAGAVALMGCVTTGGGANSLTVPLQQKGFELAGYGAGAVLDKALGKEEPEAPLSGDAILAKADATCVQEQLSEADCLRLKASAERMTALAMDVQNLDAMAKESRRKQQEEALKPQNILIGLGGAALGHQIMLERIGSIQGGAGVALP